MDGKKLQKVSQDSWGPGQDSIEPNNSQIQIRHIINLFSQRKEQMFRRQALNKIHLCHDQHSRQHIIIKQDLAQ